MFSHVSHGCQLLIGKCADPIFMFIPLGSMYGIFAYIWLIFMVNVGKKNILGSYGIGKSHAPILQLLIHTDKSSFHKSRYIYIYNGGHKRTVISRVKELHL